jgi:hypothetical protein
VLKHAAEKEQLIVDLDRELKEVREAAAADKKRLEDSLPRRGARPWRPLRIFNTAAPGRSSLLSLLRERSLAVC